MSQPSKNMVNTCVFIRFHVFLILLIEFGQADAPSIPFGFLVPVCFPRLPTSALRPPRRRRYPTPPPQGGPSGPHPTPTPGRRPSVSRRSRLLERRMRRGERASCTHTHAFPALSARTYGDHSELFHTAHTSTCPKIEHTSHFFFPAHLTGCIPSRGIFPL